MEKTKRDPIIPEMRQRLSINRDGILSSQQWRDIVMEPLTPVLLMMIPAIFVLGPRLSLLLVRGWFIALVAVGVLVLMLILRARRYARRPVFHAVLQAADTNPPGFMFWRPTVLVDASGKELKFSRWLSPRLALQQGVDYLVYYLEEPDSLVILSIVPVEHPDADLWQPTETFHRRFSQRQT